MFMILCFGFHYCFTNIHRDLKCQNRLRKPPVKKVQNAMNATLILSHSTVWSAPRIAMDSNG